MITVTVAINGKTIIHRTAVNVRRKNEIEGFHSICEYEVDDGRVLSHERRDGAKALAMAMLEGVHETKANDYAIGG